MDTVDRSSFARFWTAATVSGIGSQITLIAVPTFVVLQLHGSTTDVGLVSAARWLPYLLFGILLGAYVERCRRRPVLIWTDLGRGALLAIIPVLFWVDALRLPVLLAAMFLFGVLSLLNDAASQSWLPRLVPRADLLGANARLDQSAAVAQTGGPVIAGALIAAMGAATSVLLDAISYVISAVVTATIRVEEPASPARDRAKLRREAIDGLRWGYGHRTLGPLTLTTHGWFVGNAMLVTIYVPFALRELHLSTIALGVTVAASGVGSLVGSLVTVRLGRRWSAGRIVVASRAVHPLAWVVIAVAPSSGIPSWTIAAIVCAGQLLYGLSSGVVNAHEMAFRQAVTPDAMQARVNTSMRSINRAMVVVGAPLGGLLADHLGTRPAMWIAIGGLVVVAAALAVSPFRGAAHAQLASE